MFGATAFGAGYFAAGPPGAITRPADAAEIPPCLIVAVNAEPYSVAVPAESWVVHVDADPTVEPHL